MGYPSPSRAYSTAKELEDIQHLPKNWRHDTRNLCAIWNGQSSGYRMSPSHDNISYFDPFRLVAENRDGMLKPLPKNE